MTSDANRDLDWAARLTRQGIARERVADAEAAGLKMAKAAENLLFDPQAPIAPGAFADVLVTSPKAGK